MEATKNKDSWEKNLIMNEAKYLLESLINAEIDFRLNELENEEKIFLVGRKEDDLSIEKFNENINEYSYLQKIIRHILIFLLKKAEIEKEINENNFNHGTKEKMEIIKKFYETEIIDTLKVLNNLLLNKLKLNREEINYFLEKIKLSLENLNINDKEQNIKNIKNSAFVIAPFQFLLFSGENSGKEIEQKKFKNIYDVLDTVKKFEENDENWMYYHLFKRKLEKFLTEKEEKENMFLQNISIIKNKICGELEIDINYKYK